MPVTTQVSRRSASSARPYNIFRLAELNTFAVPLPLFDKLTETDPDAKEIALYVYLLRRAIKGPVLRISTAKMLADLDWSAKTLRAARTALANRKLILCKETQRQGWWQYEMLGVAGNKLPTYDDYIRYEDLPNDVVIAYYVDRIGNRAEDQTRSGILLFRCPFHTPKRKERSPTLRVTLNHGEDNHGSFQCASGACERYGNLTTFESHVILGKTGEWPSAADASRSVRAFMVSRMHPTPAERVMRELTERDP